ncbi:P-loop NTPase fold protein [Brasilonema bromeliae]|uniref:P-loop NTPase fold protein n=1 Tax=Brasilonema bromeliae TaxID=383615 RepID=UPI001FE3C3C6|nr:P-loop NTPase fold protein [Brasilonema bromeliae]
MSNANDLINNAIKNHNPFEGRFVVTTHNVWGQGFPDVPSLNAHASDAVYEAIEKVRNKQRQVVGITITAERGLGKSHVISRIRHRLQIDGSALFVYMSQCNDLNRITTEFLSTLANSLKQIGSQGVSQWQELATALVNEAYKKNYAPQQLVNQFRGNLAKNPKIIEVFRDTVLGIKPDIENPDILTAILWTLSPDPAYEVFAIRWLSGHHLPQSKADAMGLANISAKDKEAESFNTVRQILDLISDYKPIVVCFDEMENNTCNELGYTAQQVTAIFAKDLYDKIKRGVLLTCIFPDSWRDEVKRLPNAASVVDRIGQKVIDLKHLNSDEVVALVSGWLEDFYQEKGLTPPHRVYPFDEDKLRALGKERPIVRKVLQWCAENFKPLEDDGNIETVKRKDPVEPVYNQQLAALETTIQDYMEDKASLAQALRLGFSAVIGETIEKVQIEEIKDVKARAVDKGFIDFKVIGKENGKAVKIGVAVLQDSGGRIVGATLKRLIDYKKFDLTRGCLVRSKQINKGAAQAQQCLSELLSKNLGGEWVLLKSEDIKPLLALHFVMKGREDYELSEQQILDFIRSKRIAIDNYLIREILSDPSGEVPEDAVDEESNQGVVNTPVVSNIEEVSIDIF